MLGGASLYVDALSLSCLLARNFDCLPAGAERAALSCCSGEGHSALRTAAQGPCSCRLLLRLERVPVARVVRLPLDTDCLSHKSRAASCVDLMALPQVHWMASCESTVTANCLWRRAQSSHALCVRTNLCFGTEQRGDMDKVLSLWRHLARSCLVISCAAKKFGNIARATMEELETTCGTS